MDGKRTVYRVVVNHEEQYSIWPADREVPEGWRPTGTQGSLKEAQGHVNQVWTDMRPLSVRGGYGDDDPYRVVINHEEQYSIWPADREVPAGWRELRPGSRQKCQSYIEEVWTDMRPKSIR